MVFGTLRPATAAEGRRQEILIATLRVIAASGTDSVTHRRVAAEAEVPLGSLTYYFESREDLIREAFRFYIDQANAFLLEVEREIPPDTPKGLVDLVLEITRREFAEPEMIRAEYELILHAARDAEIGRAFAAWEMNLEARLATSLESMGATRPMNDARTLLHLVRGYELESLANRSENPAELRARLTSVMEALVGPHAKKHPERSAKVHSLSTTAKRRARQ